MWLADCLPVFLPVCLYVSPSVYFCGWLAGCLSSFRSACMSARLFTSVAACRPACLPFRHVSLHVCLPLCMPVCLSSDCLPASLHTGRMSWGAEDRAKVAVSSTLQTWPTFRKHAAKRVTSLTAPVLSTSPRNAMVAVSKISEPLYH